MTSEALERYYRRAKLREGTKPLPYLDSRGFLTIAHGHVLEKGKAVPLNAAAMHAILESDVEAKLTLCRQKLPFWDQLNDARQEALLDMAFNGSLFESPKMIMACAEEDWQRAYDETLDGPWKEQVGRRAYIIAEQIRTGEYQD